ncbi:rhodanese-like domain-containing protein [Herbaspirillum sp. RV1423]|uniref:rhodanese-like domain-containing protein n=1 Tax=Herbaspirillum sp. RV1423 TaxID=1443993 RepID=UPI0005547E58|nr:rhodanese-like domain-containing protein [Herbaspirillum sp. RV1423]
MYKLVDPNTLKNWLHDGAEIALFDVREQGQYGESHLFYGIPVPYSRLELDAPRLAPRTSVRLVVYDEDQSVALRAAARLTEIGYSDVHVLAGGTRAWQAAGYPVFAGVHVPSKTFGELVEHARHTPSVSAPVLFDMLRRGDNVLVLDGRPFSEYQKMTIPGSICCPNGELSYRVHDMIDSPDTTIVVNCAGRTRSIIGAQTLINLGLPNPVLALENGTQGWYLEDFELEHGSRRRYPDNVSDAAKERARIASASVAEQYAVATVDADEVATWLAEGASSVFLCDVRTPDEFAAGSLPRAQHAPGGQLIQATDLYVGVRHARIVVFDDDGIRAPVVASWLKQLGHNAVVLKDGLRSGLSMPAPAGITLPALKTVSVAQVAAGLQTSTMRVMDVRHSMSYRKAHIAGASWGIRSRLPALETFAGTCERVVLISDEDGVAALVAAEWRAAGSAPQVDLLQLEGGMKAWTAAQLPIESTPTQPADADCIDYLFFVHDRHDGNKAAARQYLQWETGLLAQLDQRELDGFKLD